MEAKTALLTEVGMNINCYINAKVYFKMACVRVRVQAYPHFPTTLQTIIHLGTYTGKVSIYNATKALKGTAFHLPMPFDKTQETLDAISMPQDLSSQVYSILPDPHVFILVDGKPTKDKIVWQSMIDVSNVRQAVQTL